MLLPGIREKYTATLEDIVGEAEHRAPDFSEFLGANVAEAFERTTTDVAMTENRVAEAENAAYGDMSPGYRRDVMFHGGGAAVDPWENGTPPPTIPAEEWNDKKHPLFRKGVKWREGMTVERAQIYAEDFDKRAHRQYIIDQGKTHFGFMGGSVPGFFAGILGSLPDPINMVPFGGAVARGKGVLASVGRGAAEGALGTAAVDAFVLPDLKTRGADVGFADAALDIAFGAVLGGALGGAGGWLGKRREARLEYQHAALAAMDAEAAAQAVAHQQTHGAFTLRDEGLAYGEATASLGRHADTAMHESFGPPDSFLAHDQAGEFLARNVENDSLRMTITGRDRTNVLVAAQLASEQISAGEAVNVNAVLEGSPTIQKVRIEGLVQALKTQEYTDVRFGRLRDEYKTALNEIRTETGVPLIQGDELIIPAGVVEKLYEQRVFKNGYSPELVAEVLLNVFHREADFAAATKFPHIQAIASLRRELADIGFISVNPKTGETIIKSAYSIKKDRLGKNLSLENTPEGRAIPHTVKGESPSSAAARLSALQGEQRIFNLADDVNRFAVEEPEAFIPAPEKMDAGPEAQKNAAGPDRSLEEIQAQEAIAEGNASPELALEMARAQEQAANLPTMEKVGYEIMECILGAVKI